MGHTPRVLHESDILGHLPSKRDPAMAPHRVGERMYAAARSSRLTAGWAPSNSSADSELVSSITTLRSRSRSLIRDASYAKRARTLVVNNVVGTGIGLQAQVKNSRGKPVKKVNEDLERAWKRWCRADSCHTGGRLHFKMLERQVMSQVFEAGDCFIRLHPARFGDSRVPFAVEIIEAERLAEEFSAPFLRPQPGNELRMGVEIDEYQRPVAYHIRKRHPGEIRFEGTAWDHIERVPADQILHISVIDRWPQTRGEPWLHTAARRLNDMDGYSEAEIVRARVQAATPGAIETPQKASSFGEVQDDGSVIMEVEPGVYKRLNPGEKLVFGSPTAPNSALDPFMRYMLREVAAGIGCSYESLSRDYSQSNYSSSRLALLDDRDLWRFLQTWFILDFRERLHSVWLRQAVLARAIPSISIEDYASDPEKFEAVRYKPRGWSWVDPTKEVKAYQEAVKSGFVSVTDVISQTGGGNDLEDVLDQRAQELALMKEKGLVFETSPEIYEKSNAPPSQNPPQDEEGEDDNHPPARIVTIRN